MTTFLLVRHALHSFGGDRIAGRTPDVHLSPAGEQQASSLAERMASLRIRALYSSPLDRTRETAQHVADRLELPVAICPELMELDFGDWTGKKLDELKPLDRWKQFNSFRAGTPAPNGESMLQAQSRIVGLMTDLRERHADDCIAMFSHGDVIKSAVAYFMGISLDLFHRIEISTASVSVIAVSEFGPWILGVNHTGEIPMPYA